MSDAPPPPPTPAGWYNDSAGRMRWWDGHAWTDAYAPVVVPTPRAPVNAISVTGFVLALVGLVSSVTGLFAVGLGVLGLIASIAGYGDKVRRGRGLAVAGMVVGGAAIVIALFAVVRNLSIGI